MIDIKELITRPEYRWIDEYKDRLCFLTISGSHGYGTNVEGSDVDVRGVMLPTIEELIGLKTFEQRLDEESDTCIYEFNKFIKLASNCNPNVIELLGCKEYLIFNEVGKQLLDNVKYFLSKKCIHTFGGYATAQLRRLENALCHDSYPEEDKVKHIKATMDVAMDKLEDKNKIFGDHSIQTSIKDDKLYMTINIKEEPIDLVRSTLNDIINIEKTFNKLNQRNRKKDMMHLNKHIMHLVRLYLTCFDLLEKQEIKTYRNEDREWLLQIRNGYFLEDNKLVNNFYDYLKSLESRLESAKQITQLPDKPNYKEIEKFVINVNSSVIRGTVLKYKEPLKEVII